MDNNAVRAPLAGRDHRSYSNARHPVPAGLLNGGIGHFPEGPFDAGCVFDDDLRQSGGRDGRRYGIHGNWKAERRTAARGSSGVFAITFALLEKNRSFNAP